MKMKDEHKIILMSLGGGLLFWMVDAGIDALVFTKESFLDSLRETSIRELYFRTFIVAALLSLGLVIVRFRRQRHRAEERYKNLVELSTDIIHTSDREGNLIYMNDAAFPILERTPFEVIGRPWTELLHPDDRELSAGKFKELASLRTAVVNFENRYVTRSGRTINVLHNVRVLTDLRGVFAGTQGIARDITVRKQAEEQLKLFSKAIEEAMDGIQIVDLDGRVVYSNGAVQKIYGYTPEELQGRHVNDMNADQEFAGRVIIPQIMSAGCWNGELLVVHKDGSTFPVWLSTALVKDDHGKPMAMIGIIRDITERKQAEGVLKRHHEELIKLVDERTRELSRANQNLRREIADREKMEEELLKAQKLESLGILAGGIAHDFNNLLTSIKGNVSLAMMDLGAANGAYGQLEAAERATRRAQDLTRQLLTFAKGDSLVKRTMDIRELIGEVAGFALRGSRVRHEVSFPDGLWLVDADEGQVSQVIHNLVINADHAMPEGGTISIRCENVVLGERDGIPLEAGDYVKVIVEDHGVGIAKEHLPKIFDPYFTTKQKGSGLGLATSYSIIRKHGGHIAVDSALGAGTTFRVYLPASKTAVLPRKTDDMHVLPGSGRILLMDDDEDVRSTTVNILGRLGYSVECASDGKQAIELFRSAVTSQKPFDAVIMDLTVPGGMGGKEALQQLLAIDPLVKAIVSSGYSNDPIMADYREHGFKGMVAKPYRISDLGETLRGVLQSSRPTDS